MNMKLRSNLKGNLILLITAIVWGSSFVSQRLGMNEYSLTPATFTGVRSLFGAIVLLPVILVRFKTTGKRAENPKALIIGGILCGIILSFASTLQTWGMDFPDTDAGKAGFITALYIIIVPLIGLLMGRKLSPIIFLCLILATCGMYLLCAENASGGISRGDFYVFISAILFSLHILTIDYFSPKVDGIMLSCIQFATAGIMGTAWALITGGFDISMVIAGILPLLYSGIMSCGVAYTLQVVGQKYTDPTSASLIMSLESVFAAISGAIFLKEYMSETQLIGCALTFLAIILVQLPEDFFKVKKKIS